MMKTMVSNLLTRALWACYTNSIADIRVTDVDAKSSNRSNDPHKVLAGARERERTKKYLGERASNNVSTSPPCGLYRWSPRQESEDLAVETIHPAR